MLEVYAPIVLLFTAILKENADRTSSRCLHVTRVFRCIPLTNLSFSELEASVITVMTPTLHYLLFCTSPYPLSDGTRRRDLLHMESRQPR